MSPICVRGTTAGAMRRAAPPVVGNAWGIDRMGTKNIGKSLHTGIRRTSVGKGVVISPVLHPLEVSMRTAKAAPQVLTNLTQGRLQKPLGVTKVEDPVSYAPEVRDLGLDVVAL